MNPYRIAAHVALVTSLAWLGPSIASATSMLPRNLVDLIQLSELILVGDVHTVRDGVDPDGVPYTEIGIDVDDALKGAVSPTYTFRQYGLLAPRVLSDGRTHLGVSPEGWPRFTEGERVVLFLFSPAAKTGFRTTVGLYQGKLTVERGLARNAVENITLFHDLEVDTDALTASERTLLEVRRGPVRADALLSLVRKTLENRWIETGVMRHAN